MNQYYTILKKTIASLPENNGAARRSVYSRARNAILNQLKTYDPPLSPSEITAEQLRLENAIRKTEAEAARESLGLSSRPSQSTAIPDLSQREPKPFKLPTNQKQKDNFKKKPNNTKITIEKKYLIRETKEASENSLLKASLIDFVFDENQEKIIASPFQEDKSELKDKELERDKDSLIKSLAETAARIAANFDDRNNNEKRLRKQLSYYSDYAAQEKINPRLLRRCGTSIEKRILDDDTRGSLNDWDLTEVEGFLEDHKELMRLYFRSALARAQEVKAAKIDPEFADIAPDVFNETANLLSQVKKEDGSEFIDGEISALLRDISEDITQGLDARKYTTSEVRSTELLNSALENSKNGAVLIGRFLFFTTIFIVTPPTQLVAIISLLGSLASIVGLINQQEESENIKSKYDKIIKFLPDLPKLPEK